MAEVELSVLTTTLGEYIRNEFGLWTGNDELLISCCFIAKSDNVSECPSIKDRCQSGQQHKRCLHSQPECAKLFFTGKS